MFNYGEIGFSKSRKTKPDSIIACSKGTRDNKLELSLVVFVLIGSKTIFFYLEIETSMCYLAHYA